MLEPIDEPAETESGPEGGAGGKRRKGWRIAWRLKSLSGLPVPGPVLQAERTQEFVEAGDGATEYTCWETFYGVLGPVVRLANAGAVIKGFQTGMEGLKARAEEAACAQGKS